MEEYKEALLRKYLDEELTAQEEQEALHIIADDAEMRSMLHFEQKLKADSLATRDFSSFEVPVGFSERVMSVIAQKEQSTAETGAFGRLKNWIQIVTEPRQIRLRPVYAMCMVLIITLLVGIPYYVQESPGLAVTGNDFESASVENVSDSGEQVWTRFVYIDKEAKSVSVAGDFSGWKPIELTKKNLNGDQVWTGLIPMDRGEHRYMFVKNGEQWVTDPLAAVQQDDGFGNKNAVIYL